jgi:hypothetical protein
MMPPRRATLFAAILLPLAACSRYTTSVDRASPQSAAGSGARTTAVASPFGTNNPKVRASGPQPSPADGSPGASTAPSTAPTASPTPVETSLPVASSPPKRVAIPRLPANAAPQILSVAVSETTVHSGDTVSGTVLTTSNVASVEVRIASFGQGLEKTGVGRFHLTYPVNLPIFVRGTFEMRVIARNTSGESTETTIPITVR